MSKYHNKKISFDGMIFDSKREQQRYCELSFLQKAGKIKNLQRQVKYILIPAQTEPPVVGARGGIRQGKTIERECAYIADFVYTDESGKMIVEDVKGCKTKDYIIKRKLMLHLYGIKIHEV